jgi:hypothetical protein
VTSLFVNKTQRTDTLVRVIETRNTMYYHERRWITDIKNRTTWIPIMKEQRTVCVNKNAETLLDASKEFGLEVKAEKTKWALSPCLIARIQDKTCTI